MKSADFEQKTLISNKRCRFRTKLHDSGQKMPISDKTSRFRTKDPDFEQNFTIPDKRSRFGTKGADLAPFESALFSLCVTHRCPMTHR
jgi:hypothetical protein